MVRNNETRRFQIRVTKPDMGFHMFPWPWGYPIAGWFLLGKIHLEIDDSGVPRLMETPISLSNEIICIYTFVFFLQLMVFQLNIVTLTMSMVLFNINSCCSKISRYFYLSSPKPPEMIADADGMLSQTATRNQMLPRFAELGDHSDHSA